MTVKTENLGPAERILQTLLTYSDHVNHGRPGVITRDPSNEVGVKWQAATHKVEDGKTIVYLQHKSSRTKIGELNSVTMQITDAGRNVGMYRRAGLFAEVAAWIYEKIASVWELDNEFAARWASYAFGQDHRDMKMILAAFMICQSRTGAPVLEDGKRLFDDEDYRDVGEAMMLLHRKDGKSIDPKMLLRMHDFLTLPQIAEINRRLGFGKSTRRNFVGRWTKVVHKWLAFREQNPKVLQGLVDAGFRQTVMELCRRSGYKPDTVGFFQALRWKQKQAKDGRREMAIGMAVATSATELWKDLSEKEICQAITVEKPSWKRIIGLLGGRAPTRTMLAAAIDADALSDKDLVIMTPTLEELNLLGTQVYRLRHEKALRAAEDMRAINISKNVRSVDLKEKLQAAADGALQKKVEAVTRFLRTYVFVDISGSMNTAIEQAKVFLAQFIQGFPLDRVHVFTFNSQGMHVKIPHRSAKGVESAFQGKKADGGTSYQAGVRAARDFKPADGEDVLFIFVGDEGQTSTFETEVQASGLRPTAFGLLKIQSHDSHHTAVVDTARKLSIPCFPITKEMLADPVALPRIIPDIIAATPTGKPIVGAPAPLRVSLVETISKTDLLQKPCWAA